jgi:hypothetical protein
MKGSNSLASLINGRKQTWDFVSAWIVGRAPAGAFASGCLSLVPIKVAPLGQTFPGNRNRGFKW